MGDRSVAHFLIFRQTFLGYNNVNVFSLAATNYFKRNGVANAHVKHCIYNMILTSYLKRATIDGCDFKAQ